MSETSITKAPCKMVSLFAGIGGFELAFQSVGISTVLMCEIDPIAKHVLQSNIPGVPIIDDVCTMSELPDGTDILCAGFPCQDLSSVGVKKGLSGSRSSLVKEVFRLLENNRCEWVIFENVSFMLSLRNGEAIRTIVSELERLGYNWAYRSIDSIAFVPQHRCRVFVVASLHNDPKNVILSGSQDKKLGVVDFDNFNTPLGFYWTEGKSALGLVSDGLPTLKAGSTIGIPSAPAIAFPDGEISTPDIRDAERLQGFPAGWTAPAEEVAKCSSRWKLVGNAVTVNTVSWIANKIINPEKYDISSDKPLISDKKWPKAAWGNKEGRFESNAGLYPPCSEKLPLSEFLLFPRKPLSLKASKGFEQRLSVGGMKCPEYFKQTISNHINLMSEQNGNTN